MLIENIGPIPTVTMLRHLRTRSQSRLCELWQASAVASSNSLLSPVCVCACVFVFSRWAMSTRVSRVSRSYNCYHHHPRLIQATRPIQAINNHHPRLIQAINKHHPRLIQAINKPCSNQSRR